MKSKIYIILPVFNRLNFTKRCIKSIYNQTYKNFELILIDDGSSDGTGFYVKTKYPKTKIIKGDGNWWWTRSMYEGARYVLKYAKISDYLLMMNNDLYFAPDYLNNLVSIASKNIRTIVGSICVHNHNPKIVVEAGIRIDWKTGLVYGIAQTVSNKLSYYKDKETIENLDALPGKGTLVPISVFRSGVNFKYKTLPHYLSDYEFSANAKGHGYKLVVATKAVARHYWEATGISIKDPTKLVGYRDAIKILFGRKSMNNIIDWIRFVNLHCPRKYKLRNYFYSFLKIFYAALLVKPFNLLKYPIKAAAITYHSIKYPKLAIKRVKQKLGLSE